MTVETKTWAVEITDETLDGLYAAYNAASKHVVETGFSDQALKVKLALENALVALGMLEADPEQEDDGYGEDDSEADSWEEWMWDQKFEAQRDLDLMGYER